MMRILNRLAVLLFVGVLVSSCGGGGGAVTPTDIKGTATIDNGALNVKMSESFGYTFPKAVDPASVTADTFFIAPAASACAEKIAGLVSCASETSCTFIAEASLTQCLEYSLCLTSEISFADGTLFDGDKINFNTLCCSTYFGSSACTYTGQGSPNATSTFSYELFLTVESSGELPVGSSECICRVASDAGDSGCIGLNSLMSASSICGFDLGGGDSSSRALVHQLGQPGGPSAKGQIFTVDINSTDPAFMLYVDYDDSVSDGEDISNMQYMLFMMESERFCDGSCTASAVNLCSGQSECSVGVTGTMVAGFLNQFEATHFLLSRYNNNQCVDVWFAWEALGVDPNFESGGQSSSDLLYLRLQRTEGACN